MTRFLNHTFKDQTCEEKTLHQSCEDYMHQTYYETPAWGHQQVGGFTLVEGLSPEIAILTVSGESLRTHYEEGPEILDRPA